MNEQFPAAVVGFQIAPLVPNRAHEGKALSQQARLRLGPKTKEWAAGLWSSKVLSFCLREGGL